ncbi:MAG TPA: YchJ family metal-binding protein [Gammaproteobacteria bacterium]|jgi:SEC-C motif-containing protein|nr:YchJ family metal-binding protein [Gammaproteobacteria bacterium]
MNPNKQKSMQHCPCGSGKDYTNCCGVFISNQGIPSTPEALMRSRYTAYYQVNMDYIARTMKSPAADHFDAEDARKWAEKISWVGLDVIKTKSDSLKGTVEFRAYYIINGKKNMLHEISEFIFEDGRWYYVDGTQPKTKPRP